MPQVLFVLPCGKPLFRFRRTLPLSTPQNTLHTTVFENSISTRIIDRSNDRKFSRKLTHSTFGYRIRQIITEFNIGKLDVRPAIRYISNPWTLPVKTMCDGLADIKKSQTPPNILKGIFNDHCSDSHDNSIHIYTDGSKSEEKVGFACILPSVTFKKNLPPQASIYTAELCAILSAISLAMPLLSSNFTIFSDSKSALQAVTNKFSKHPIVKEIHVWLNILAKKGKIFNFCWIPSHIGLEGNEKADKLAKEAATIVRTVERSLPVKDYYPKFKEFFMNIGKTRGTIATAN